MDSEKTSVKVLFSWRISERISYPVNQVYAPNSVFSNVYTKWTEKWLYIDSAKALYISYSIINAADKTTDM